jgi:hypothetical protein
VTDITDLAGNIVDYVKNAFCPVTLTSEAGTCVAGAGGLSFVVIASLLYLTYDSLKKEVGNAIDRRPIAAAAIIIFVGQALFIPDIYAISSTFAVIAAWALFGRYLPRYQLHFRGHALRLDNATMLCAPMMYFLICGADTA